MTTETPTLALIGHNGDLLPCSRTIHNLSHEINRTIAHAQKRLQEYADYLAADPYAAVQQFNPFRNAAQIESWRRAHDRLVGLVERKLDDATVLAKLKEHYVAATLDGAGDIGFEQTSAPLVNLLHRERLSAFADIVRLLNGVI